MSEISGAVLYNSRSGHEFRYHVGDHSAPEELIDHTLRTYIEDYEEHIKEGDNIILFAVLADGSRYELLRVQLVRYALPYLAVRHHAPLGVYYTCRRL